MSERYSRLFALSGETYTPGAPVTLAAGALLKDNQTGKVLAQLKLRSISPKTIKAAKVQIIPMDTVGRPLGEPVEHAYLDLTVSRNVDFGQKSAIMLPDAECRRFSARVTEVAFGDNTVWSSNVEWKPLPYARPLQEALPDVELYKQYRLTYGNQCRYLPLEHEDLWYCGCGALNRKEEGACHLCGLELFRLKTVDWAALDVQKNARVAAEQAEAKRLAEEQAKADAARRAEEARQQEIAAAKAKKKKKTAAICAVLAVVVCAAAYVVTQIILPAQAQKEAYAKAQELFEQGKYEEAIHAFTALGEYEDSAEMVATVSEAWKEAQYQQAITALNAEEYESAKKQFEALGNYKDSADQAAAAKVLIQKHNDYLKAISLVEKGSYDVAIACFERILDYKDSSELLEQAKEQKLETDYQTAVSAYNSGNYLHAQELFEALGQYKDSETMKTKALDGRYTAAIESLSSKDYIKTRNAYAAFRALGDYKDSTQQLANCLKQLADNNIVPFGVSNNISSTQLLNWTVLKRSGNTYTLFIDNLTLSSLGLTDAERSFLSKEPQHPTKAQATQYLLPNSLLPAFSKGWCLHLQDGYDLYNEKVYTCDPTDRFHYINWYVLEITLP